MGLLKNSKKIFNRYQNKHLSLKYRFVDSNTKAEKFVEMVDRAKGRNYFQSLIHPVELMRVATTKFDLFSNYIYSFIDDFTNHTEKDNEYIDAFKRYLIERFNEIDNIEYENRDFCTIKLKNGKEICFQTFTSSFDGVLDIWKDLLSSKRKGKCHVRSLSIASHIKAKSVDCVTGTVYPYVSGSKYLHTWVEFQDEKDNVWCIDNNLNVVMLKDNYYKLMHAKPFERISQSQIIEDIDAIYYFNDNNCDKTPYLKLYCSSREEGLERYKEIMGY